MLAPTTYVAEPGQSRHSNSHTYKAQGYQRHIQALSNIPANIFRQNHLLSTPVHPSQRSHNTTSFGAFPSHIPPPNLPTPYTFMAHPVQSAAFPVSSGIIHNDTVYLPPGRNPTPQINAALANLGHMDIFLHKRRDEARRRMLQQRPEFASILRPCVIRVLREIPLELVSTVMSFVAKEDEQTTEKYPVVIVERLPNLPDEFWMSGPMRVPNYHQDFGVLLLEDVNVLLNTFHFVVHPIEPRRNDHVEDDDVIMTNVVVPSKLPPLPVLRVPYPETTKKMVSREIIEISPSLSECDQPMPPPKSSQRQRKRRREEKSEIPPKKKRRMGASKSHRSKKSTEFCLRRVSQVYSDQYSDQSHLRRNKPFCQSQMIVQSEQAVDRSEFMCVYGPPSGKYHQIITKFQGYLSHPRVKHSSLNVYHGSQVTPEYMRSSRFWRPFKVAHFREVGAELPCYAEIQIDSIAQKFPPETEIRCINVGKQRERRSWMKLSSFTKTFKKPVDSRKDVLNLLSFEISQTEFGKELQRPACIGQIDWVELYWKSREAESRRRKRHLAKGDKKTARKYRKFLCDIQLDDNEPIDSHMPVQKFLLISQANSWTDFHIDFGGTSVWYILARGYKYFFVVEPTDDNLAKFYAWSELDKFERPFFPQYADVECHVVKLGEGETLFLPSGWIHAVLTPVDSMAFGGNFLHDSAISMQTRIFAQEMKLEEDANEFCFPRFEEIHWVRINALVGQLQKEQVFYRNEIEQFAALLFFLSDCKSNLDATADQEYAIACMKAILSPGMMPDDVITLVQRSFENNAMFLDALRDLEEAVETVEEQEDGDTMNKVV